MSNVGVVSTLVEGSGGKMPELSRDAEGKTCGGKVCRGRQVLENDRVPGTSEKEYCCPSLELSIPRQVLRCLVFHACVLQQTNKKNPQLKFLIFQELLMGGKIVSLIQ